MSPGADWKSSDAIRRAIGSAEHALESHGRVLIRASGTEPVLRVMVEAAGAEGRAFGTRKRLRRS